MEFGSDNHQLHYFSRTPIYYQFVILKKIKELRYIDLPVNSTDMELREAISIVHLKDLLDQNLIEKESVQNRTYLKLTSTGDTLLKRHYIDYQLSLLNLENIVGTFFLDLINRLKNENLTKIALYGASDTSKSIFRYLVKNNIDVMCVLDDDIHKHYKPFFNVKIVPPKEIKDYPIDAIIISTIRYQEELVAKTKRAFGKKIKILTLFDLK